MKGILFKPDMIKAIMEERKTQTRRLTPRYLPGETVYVKEGLIRVPRMWNGDTGYPCEAVYSIDNVPSKCESWPWQRDILSAMFLPQGLARTFLLIEDVKPQRLQEITEEDAIAEGITKITASLEVFHWDPQADKYKVHGFASARGAYISLWDSINKKPGTRFGDNPWDWAYTFKVIKH
jgi:hypothetical protein